MTKRFLDYAGYRTIGMETQMVDKWGSSLVVKEESEMKIEEALQWAYDIGRNTERDRQLIAAQGERVRELEMHEKDLHERLKKLAADLQQLVQENEALRANATRQANDLTKEVETLKAKLAQLEGKKRR